VNGNVVEVILRLRDEASAALRKVTEETASFQRGLANLRQGITGLGSSLGAIVGSGGLLYALKSAADTAFQAQSQMRVLAGAAKAAGVDFQGLVSGLNEVLRPLGVLPEQAAGATAQLLRAGFTTEQILAAFQSGAASAMLAGKTAAQGIENVAMALSTGQSIYLNYIGIAENIGPVLQKVASSMKGASEEAIKQAQNQAALNVILAATKQEVAALPSIMQGPIAAQIRYNQALYEYQVAIGEAVLPYLTKFYEALAAIANRFNSLSPEIKKAIGTGAVAAGGILGLGTALGLAYPVVQNLITILRGLAMVLGAVLLNPITLVIGAIGLLITAWVRAGESAEEQRRRLMLVGQAFMGLAQMAKGAVEAVVGLVANLGSSIAALAKAAWQALHFDFAGAWETLKSAINLEAFTARWQAANRDLSAGWSLLSSTLKGEVTESFKGTVNKAQDLLDQLRGLKGQADSSQPTFKNYAEAAEKAGKSTEGLGDKAKKTKEKVKELKEEVKSLSEKIEEYVQYTQTRLEGAGLIPKINVRAFRDQVEEAIRLADFTALGTLIESITGALANPNLTEAVRNQLKQILEAATDAYNRMAKEVEKQVEAELDARQKLAEVYTQQAEEEARLFEKLADTIIEQTWRELDAIKQAAEAEVRIRAEATRKILELQDAARRDLEKAFDIPDAFKGLQERWEYIRNLLSLGLIDEDAFRSEAQFIRDTILGALEDLSDLAATPEGAKLLLNAKKLGEEIGKALEPPVDPTETAIAKLADEIKNQAVDIPKTLQELITDPVTAAIYAVETGVMDVGDALAFLRESAANAQDELQRFANEGLITRNEYLKAKDALKAYDAAIKDLTERAVAALPPLQELTAEAEEFKPAPDWWDLDGLLKGYKDELARIRSLGDPFAQMRGIQALQQDLSYLLPALWEWVRGLEEAGDASGYTEEEIARLKAQVTELQTTVQSATVDWGRFAKEAANGLKGIWNGIQGIIDAFNSASLGQGISRFASAIAGIADMLLPGAGSLVSILGSIVGSIIDGIISVFDDGLKKVHETLAKTASKYTYLSTEAFKSAVYQYTETYLWGLIQRTKYAVDQATLSLLESVAGALDKGIIGALKSAGKAFLEGKLDWLDNLRNGVRDAIMNAVMEGVVQSAIFKGTIGNLLDQLTELVGKGWYPEANAVAQQIMAKIPELAGYLAAFLDQFRLSLYGGTPERPGLDYTKPPAPSAAPSTQGAESTPPAPSASSQGTAPAPAPAGPTFAETVGVFREAVDAWGGIRDVFSSAVSTFASSITAFGDWVAGLKEVAMSPAITVNVYGNIYGVDDLERTLDEYARSRAYVVYGGVA